MTTPIIADVFRVGFPFHSNGGGITVHNGFHVHASLIDSAGVAAVIDSAMQHTADPVLPGISGKIETTLLEITSLATAAPTQLEPLTFTLGGGGGAGDYIVQGSLCMSLRTATRGPRGRGRIYWGPVVEAAQSDGKIDNTVLLDFQAKWEDIFADMAANGVTIGVASYTHGDFHPVTSFHTDPVITTQRRRLRQLR